MYCLVDIHMFLGTYSDFVAGLGTCILEEQQLSRIDTYLTLV